MTAPTWQELRDAGRILIDEPDRGLAIYPTSHGNVVIGVRGGDGNLHLLPILLAEFDSVATALAESAARAAAAQEVLRREASQFEAYHVIQRAKGCT